MAETEILKPKIHATGILEVVGIGIAKQLEEKLTAPVIGNGTMGSAIAKGLAGGLIRSFLPRGTVTDIISGAFLVDAGEDAALSLLNMTGVNAPAQSAGPDW